MPSQISLSKAVLASLRCPVCKSKLNAEDGHFDCVNSECSAHFPVVGGIPILLNENTSLFSADDLLAEQNKSSDQRPNRVKEIYRRLIPSASRRIKSKQNFEKLTSLLLSQNPTPRVLIVGGKSAGQGINPLVSNPGIELVETDVMFGQRTALVCDAHDLPFDDDFFDGAVAQALLEHVADPFRCVEELHRVLKSHGLVYAETPFMVPVHLAPYDFTRFTHLGHRRLFRKFDEIDSGATGGSGMALAWAYQHFLPSLVSSSRFRAWIEAFAALTSFPLKYIDHFSINNPGTLDAAAVYYFMGRKEGNLLLDRELINLYRGARK